MDDEFGQVAGRTAVIVGSLLVVVAAIWSWQEPLAAAWVYALLAVGAGGVAWVTQRSRLLWLMSGALALSTAAWLASGGANPAELALPWALLSIFHMAAAVIGGISFTVKTSAIFSAAVRRGPCFGRRGAAAAAAAAG
ncbi:MAG: hypothetical protein M5U34_20460 [Chloroflexi bacterium]|nr:hypothetical protein [Chloroflexota bacterium]